MASKDKGHKEKKRPKKGKAKVSKVANRAPLPEPERRGRVARDREE